MLTIETIARLLLEVNIPFTYTVDSKLRKLEVQPNGKIKRFTVEFYPKQERMVITNSSLDEIEINDLLYSIYQLFRKPG